MTTSVFLGSTIRSSLTITISFSKEGYEADDLLATYTNQVLQQSGRVTLVTGDKDMMQLVSPQCTIYSPFTTQKIVTEKEVLEKFGVQGSLVHHVQAFCGDAADNIPGVKGIGLITATKLIVEHKSVDGVFSALARGGIEGRAGKLLLAEGAEQSARTSLKLTTLVGDVTLKTPLSDLYRRPIQREKLRSWMTEQKFWSILKCATPYF